ncbi:MAG: aldo/keto reductase [Cytophagales bacterium]|nr:aldo/keto reductase [Cytophagales bacterium]
MQKIKLAPHLPDFSRIVYGAWRMSDDVDNAPKDALQKIHAALDIGITTFDHADIYGDYSCETLFGAALRLDASIKERIQIVTKCDIMLTSDKYPDRRFKHYDTTAAHIRASVDASLARLDVDVIDVLLLHRPDPLMDAAATGACLDDLVQTGKIRAAGVSNFTTWDWDLLQANMRTPLVTNQLEISLLATQALSDGTLAQAQQHKAPPMAWSPLGGGALFSDDAVANRLRPALHRIAMQHGVMIDAVAVAWLLAHPARILPIMGTNNLARIAQLGDAFKVAMPRETWFELLELARGHEVA